MASLNVGLGLSGIVMNVIMIVNIHTGGSIMVFYAINVAIMLIAASLFYLERKNTFIKENCEIQSKGYSIRDVYISSQKAKNQLLYLIQIYILTFTVFPGITNSAGLSFLKKSSPYFQIFFVTIFNFFDTFGRFLAGKLRIEYWRRLCWVRII